MLVLEDRDFTGRDLRAVLQGDSPPRTFRRCSFAGADLRGASLGPLSLELVRELDGALVSPDQAAHLCAALGLHVVP